MTAQASDRSIQHAIDRQTQWVEGLERSASRFRMLGTLPFGKVDFWNRVVTTIGPRPNRLGALSSRIGIPDIFLIGRLLARAHRQDVVLLAGGERSDLIYAAIAGLCPWIRTPHVIVDAHWQKSPGLAGQVQRLLLRLARRLLREVQPHSPEEIDLYADVFGLDRHILRDIPWSTSMIGHDTVEPDPASPAQPWVLTGGHSFRDYPPLLQACQALNLPLKMGVSHGAQSAALQTLVRRHSVVSLHGDWSNAQYIQQMQQCSLFALPIEPGLTRSTADQTLLNAMWLGKTVVASSSIGSRIYIRDGVNGFLVHEPTAAAWQARMQYALNLDDPARQRLTAQAIFDARVHFNEHIRLGRTLDNVLALLDPSHRRSWVHPNVGQTAADVDAATPS